MTDNQNARQKNREAAKAAVELLSSNYPEVFNLKDPKPLKVGIHEELAADEKVSKTKIRRALSAYVRHYNYISCLVEGADRINLKGEVDGVVSADEAQHAKEKVDAIDKAKAEKRKEFAQKKKVQQQKVKQKEQRINNKLEQLIAKSGKPQN